MASFLFSRSFMSIRSIQTSAFFPMESKIYASFLKQSTIFSLVAFPSLVSHKSCFVHSTVTASPSLRTSVSTMALSEPVASPDWLYANPREPDCKRSTAFACAAFPSLVSHKSCSVHSVATDSPTLTSIAPNEPVVSPDWLHANLREPDFKVLDASWYMPGEQRNPFQEFQVAHIPGALFFDIDGISNRKSNLPHMLPSEEAFSAAVSALGIENNDNVVVYDGKGIFSAARVWWMFRAFGHDKIWVLDGGLPHWRASGYDVESSAAGDAVLKASAAIEAIEKVYQGQTVHPTTFEAKIQPHLIWSLAQVKQNIEGQTHQHVDARSKARFDGAAPEPRKGVRGGHVPGSKCIPFEQVLDGSQMLLLAKEELAKKFEHEGISLDCPVVASCGTGITACILALGLHRLGKTNVAVYDGSWTEWGSESDTSIASSSSS